MWYVAYRNSMSHASIAYGWPKDHSRQWLLDELSRAKDIAQLDTKSAVSTKRKLHVIQHHLTEISYNFTVKRIWLPLVKDNKIDEIDESTTMNGAPMSWRSIIDKEAKLSNSSNMESSSKEQSQQHKKHLSYNSNRGRWSITRRATGDDN